ncbi:MAG: primosomal protein N', partial [candidate division KSB1 bacterium]|nr:primosomal protein N' [candidate division KSB1 bacterium]
MSEPIKNPYAQVVFPVALDRAFTYRIPERFRDDVVPGVRVLCPFGRRRLTGFVVERNAEAAVSDLKEIEEVLDPTPLFTPQVLQLARWIADYYLCGWGEVLKAALPSGIHLDSQRVVRLMHSKPEELADSLQERAPRQAEIIRRLALQNPMRISRLAANLGKNVYAALQPLREKGLVRIELELPEPRVKAKYEIVARLAPHLTLDKIGSIISELQSKAPKQAAVLAALLDVVGGELSRADLRRLTGAGHAVFTVLAERGFIILDKREVVREYYQELEVEEPPKLTLNPDQQAALEAVTAALDAGKFETFLLHGVTGSGKTQVYIDA